MHLLRRYAARKTRRYRVYLYIRSSAYKRKKIRPDIPLGRMDRKQPRKTVESWLECSENMPGVLRGRLTRDDVLDLYDAILTGGSWVRLERLLPQANSKRSPQLTWGIPEESGDMESHG